MSKLFSHNFEIWMEDKHPMFYKSFAYIAFIFIIAAFVCMYYSFVGANWWWKGLIAIIMLFAVIKSLYKAQKEVYYEEFLRELNRKKW